jgi:putative membrane-bound dehydrogenase-like protein
MRAAFKAIFSLTLLLTLAARAVAAETASATPETPAPAVTTAALAPLPADLAALVAAEKPLTPSQALAAMRPEPGVWVELAAAEPLTGDPVALAWDERGRLFVAENRGYPEGAPDGSPMGVIAMLEDTDRDGAYDRRTEFATGLSYPNGLLPWRGGLFVTCAPDILHLKDTDGDGRADVRKVVLTGFELGKTTQIRVAHPRLGLDGWVYLTSGLTGGKVTSPEHPERPAVEFKKNDTRFHPDTYVVEVVPGVAQFGQCFDAFGRKFTVDNRHPFQMVVLDPRYLKRNPHLAFSDTVTDVAAADKLGFVYPLARDQTTASMHTNLLRSPHAGTFTSSCGIEIYDGTALPPPLRGNAIICEPAQALVQRQVIRPAGAVFAGAHPSPGRELLVTADSWFRPVFAANGPDGALYIASMYRKFIDHPQYVPAEMREKLDFISGRHQGRIYRLVAADRPVPRQPVNLGDASTREWVATLENPNAWWRETAFRLLLERADRAAITPLRALAKSGRTAEARVAALHLLQHLGALEDSRLLTLLADAHPGVRENALKLAEPRLAANARLAAQIKRLADDADPRVRFQVALALGELPDSDAVPLLARIAVRDAQDKWTRAAALSSVGGRVTEFLEAVLHEAAAARAAGLNELLAETCRVAGAASPPEALSGLLARLTTAPGLEYPARAAAVSGLGEALRPRKWTLTRAAEGQPAAREGLERLMRSALELITNAGQPLAARLAAIHLLAFADAATIRESLHALLTPREPTELQVAAVKVLLQLPGAESATRLLAPQHWKSLTPPVREAALAGLLAQPAGVKALLDAMETGVLPPGTLDPARRGQLLRHRDQSVAQRAAKLFEGMQSGDRMKVFEEYKAILTLPPDARNGRAIFTRTCAPCHVLNGEGFTLGPELTGIRNQPAEVLLLHILVPSYEIVAGFNAYEIETTDGRSLTGLLASETPTSVTLRRAQGEQETVLRSEIAAISSSPLSLMPDELEKTMSCQDLRDLIGFLRGE